MELGTQLPTYSTGEHCLPGDVVRDWARRAETVGFESLWTIDHLVKPHTYATSVLDPLVALSHAAAVTDRVELGTGVVVLPLRRTAAAAKRALSVQQLAGRQLHLGVGAGYNRDEFAVSGVPRSERGPRLSEAVEVLQALFSGESVSFDGRFHAFEEIEMDPVFETPPRILSAGGSRTDEDGDRRFPEPILRRVLRADGWIAQPTQPATVAEEVALIDEYARDQGVDPDAVEKTVLTYAHLVDGDDRAVEREQREAFTRLFGPDGYERAREHLLVGTLDEVREDVAAYDDAGVDRLVLGPASTDSTQYDTQLDLFADEIVPYVG